MSVHLGMLTVTAGTNTTFSEVAQEGIRAVIIGNESGLTTVITMEGGSVQKTLYPGTVDWFDVKKGFSGTIKISPSAVLNNVASWPASSLLFDAVGPNDPEQASNYPLALSRNTNIGNTVGTTGGSTTSVTNDNQPLTPQNQFIEATPTGASGSTVVIATDGTVTIKGDVANVLTTLLQLIPGAASGASSVKLGDSTRWTEVLGTLLVDGGKIGTVTPGDIIDGSGFDTFLKSRATSVGNLVRFQNPQGTDQVTIDGNGKVTFSGDIVVNGAGTGLSVANNESITGNSAIGGTLSVTGASTLTGALTATANSSSVVSKSNVLNGGANLATGRLGISADGDILDANSTTATYIKARNSGFIVFQTPNGTEQARIDTTGVLVPSGNNFDISAGGTLKLRAGAITRQTGFSGTGSGTFNTNLGAAPNQIVFNPCTVSGSSQTIGGTDAQSSVVTTGAGLAWAGIAWKDT